jgi:hypothetical protein
MTGWWWEPGGRQEYAPTQSMGASKKWKTSRRFCCDDWVIRVSLREVRGWDTISPPLCALCVLRGLIFSHHKGHGPHRNAGARIGMQGPASECGARRPIAFTLRVHCFLIRGIRVNVLFLPPNFAY